MEVFFTDIKTQILNRLQEAEKEILIAVSWFTDREIFNLVMKKLGDGVSVQLITRNDYLNNHESALPWQTFVKQGGVLRFCGPGNLLHYKFVVTDQNLVMATSYNWCCFAGNNNRENLFLIRDPETVRSFTEEYRYLSSLYPPETEPARFSAENVHPKLAGFYELTLQDDHKNQRV